jgi:hypothetical protein
MRTRPTSGSLPEVIENVREVAEPVPAVTTEAPVPGDGGGWLSPSARCPPGGPARPARRPATAEAIESQNRALRELSRRAFPDPDPGDQPTPLEIARAQRRRAGNVR